MKYIGFLILFFPLNQSSFAQKSTINTFPLSLAYNYNLQEEQFTSPNPDLLNISNGAKLISISTSDIYFHKTYLINKEGESLSSGYMQSPYFLPNDNLIVISGHTNRRKDSFNPYGAYDMVSMVVLGTFNKFLSRIKRNKR
jgi:hypothetical protein